MPSYLEQPLFPLAVLAPLMLGKIEAALANEKLDPRSLTPSPSRRDDPPTAGHGRSHSPPQSNAGARLGLRSSGVGGGAGAGGTRPELLIVTLR